MRPEAELALVCARAVLTAAERRRLDELLARVIDWPHVLHWAARHGLVPLLHHHLAVGRGAGPPAWVRDRLRAHARAIAGRNLRMTAELLRIVDRLESRGIPLIPYKGPLLAVTAYGSLSLRSFDDLDVLIAPGHVLAAKRLLMEDGYRPLYPLSPAAEAAYLRHDCEYILEREPIRVELHWRILPDYFCVSLDVNRFWARAITTSVAGTTVPTLAPEDLLLTLCAHATKHCWNQLELVASIAEVARRHPAMDWHDVRAAATRAGAMRILDLGLCLARDLIEVDLPASELDALDGNRQARALAREISERLLADDPGVLDRPRQVRFHLRTRERLRDRLGYVVRLATTQTIGDWQLVGLPTGAGGLYRVIRPLRLLGKFGPRAIARVLGALAGRPVKRRRGLEPSG